MPEDHTGQDDTPQDGSGSAERRLIDAARAAAADGSSGSGAPVGRPLPVDRFDGYQVIREIHRGGQGVVYQGVHLSTGRKIAIKVMHAGPFATASDRKRFEREVEILAQLSHPNIVDVLDSGEADGSFFYVMEYISGRTLDLYIEQQALAQGEVIALAAKICDAVNAAHLRGVIHRDLKPANIRVDSSGEPHIVDFGLAKVAGGSSGSGPGEAMMTMTGQFLGSLPWASPEQAEGAPDKIDVRTDVYSLGVVIFQLLTGAFPYEVVGNMRDVLDNILKAEPKRPSTVRRKINNEIETIVLKCLSKERDRRYQNAGEIGRDLHRYLRGEPIEAKRDSSWYVLRKMARRHRAMAIAGGMMLVMLVVFSILMSVLWRDADRARAIADVERVRATEAESVAQLEASRATSVQQLLRSILAGANPSLRPGHEVTVVEFLDDAREQLDRDLSQPPLVEAIVRYTIGQSYLSLTRYARAAEQFRAAAKLYARELGDDDEHTIDAMHELALALRNQASYGEAEVIYRRVIEYYTARGGLDDRDRLIALVNLGQALSPQGKVEEAIGALEEARGRLEATLGASHELTLMARSNLAAARSRLATPAALFEALRAQRATLTELEGQHPWPSPESAKARLDLALILKRLDEFEEAEFLLRKSVEELEAIIPSGLHAGLIATRSHLALVVHARERYTDAEPIFRRVLDDTRRLAEPNPMVLAFYRGNLGVCLMRQGDHDRAELELKPAVDALLGMRRPGQGNNRITNDLVGRIVELYELMERGEDADHYRAMLNPAEPDGP